MKTNVESEDRTFIRFKKRAGLLALILFLPVMARGGGVVTNCTEADRRAAMSGGGLVTFACDGTITLTNTITITENAVLDATGHQITISGSNAVQVFSVASNVTFTVVSLTIANGRSEFGAGVNNLGGIVNLLGMVLQNNVALAAAGRGGALCNWGGVINATNCGFYGNVGSEPDQQSAFGEAADIGAYEYATLLRISRSQSNGLDILLRDGIPGQTCRLLTSTNLSAWQSVATNQVGADGACLFQGSCSAAEPQRFYRAVLP